MESYSRLRTIFGAGLSQISIELQRRMRSKFIAKSVAFIRFNRYLLRYILVPVFPFGTEAYCRGFLLSTRNKDTLGEVSPAG